VDRGRATVPHLRALPDFVQIARTRAKTIPILPKERSASHVRHREADSGNTPANWLAKVFCFAHFLTLLGFLTRDTKTA
jgi:hypothetical protein